MPDSIPPDPTGEPQQEPATPPFPPHQSTVDQPVEGPGSRVGTYKLLEQIGAGGMGVVYAAAQEQPVRRRVALKIIKPGMDSDRVIARFEAERQALAMMDHPNIARVLDAGTTDNGRPYFVMELVSGVPITRYCDESRLSVPERLDLFMSVCRAVQHAHTKGIIHRDLKPSNILITVQDGKPVPKVIDFGVAKALHQPLTDHTLYTEIGAVIGTLEYMSPEQAELSPLGIDTRTDVYALGVLLYELLAGTPPFERRRLRSAAFNEALRIIKEEEPPKPSTRLSHSKESLSSLAAQRATEPGRLTRQLRGELDWIVLKCLEKDRGRRYETANGLARDIERYLTHEPVEACPPSAMYRLRKLARRNRGVFAAGAVVAVLLVAGIAVSSWLAIRAARAEALAQARLKESEEARAEAEAVREFLVEDMIEAAAPVRTLGREVTVDKVLAEAEARIGERFADQPLQEAAVRLTLGRVYRELGEHVKAEAHLRRARALFTEHHGPRDRRTVETMNVLAHTLWQSGRFDEAGQIVDSAGEIARQEFGHTDNETLWAEYIMGIVLLVQNRISEGEAKMRQVLEASAAYPEHRRTLWAKGDLAAILAYRGELDEALALQKEVVSDRYRIYGENHPDTLVAERNSAHFLLAREQFAEAQQMFRQVLEKSRAIYNPTHISLGTAMTNLAWALASPAEPTYQNLEMAATLVQMGKPLLKGNTYELATAWTTEGVIHYRRDQFKEAIASLDESDSQHQQHVKAMNAFFRAMSYWRLNEKEKAREQYEEGIKLMAIPPTDPDAHRVRSETERLLQIKNTLQPPK